MIRFELSAKAEGSSVVSVIAADIGAKCTGFGEEGLFLNEAVLTETLAGSNCEFK